MPRALTGRPTKSVARQCRLPPDTHARAERAALVLTQGSLGALVELAGVWHAAELLEPDLSLLHRAPPPGPDAPAELMLDIAERVLALRDRVRAEPRHTLAPELREVLEASLRDLIRTIALVEDDR